MYEHFVKPVRDQAHDDDARYQDRDDPARGRCFDGRYAESVARPPWLLLATAKMMPRSDDGNSANFRRALR
jgi:hypothetical protein